MYPPPVTTLTVKNTESNSAILRGYWKANSCSHYPTPPCYLVLGDLNFNVKKTKKTISTAYTITVWMLSLYGIVWYPGVHLSINSQAYQ